MPDIVAITGAGGTLGRSVAPALLAAGYRVRSADVRPIEAIAGEEVMMADIRDAAAARVLLDGVVAIVHAAAWHGIHLRDHSPSDFWDLNVVGTWNVYRAATDAGVRAIVFSSTMGVYGASRRPAQDAPAVRVHEDLPLLPGDVYGLSKVLGEEIAVYHARADGIAGAALRYGMFVPEPFHRAGVRFLHGGVDERDVASAVLAALGRALERGGWLGAFNVESPLPFTADDGRLLRDDPLAAIARHWPDGPGLLAAAGVEPWGPIDEVFDIDRAERELGWRPRYGFAGYLAALRDGREELLAEDAPGP